MQSKAEQWAFLFAGMVGGSVWIGGVSRHHAVLWLPLLMLLRACALRVAKGLKVSKFQSREAFSCLYHTA